MPKWMLGRALTLIGMVGIPLAGANAQDFDSRTFKSESAAREYLRQNPTGPRANAAFLALTEYRLTRQNPGLTREQVISGFGAKRSSSSGRSNAKAGQSGSRGNKSPQNSGAPRGPQGPQEDGSRDNDPY